MVHPLLIGWRIGCLLLALVACGLPSCAPRVAERRMWQPRGFIIGLHGAPPTKSEHYAAVRRAGFNLVLGHVGPDALDMARRHGLKLGVGRIGMDVQTFANVEGRQRALHLIEQARGHAALWGYHLGDGAHEKDFAAYRRLASFVRELDPKPPAFIGLHGAGAWLGPSLASGDYPGYLRRFVRQVRPELLCASLSEGGLAAETLEHLRRATCGRGLQFLVVIATGDGKARRPLGEATLRSQAYLSLAYGARGVVWSGLYASRRGGPANPYAAVATFNRELRALGPVLLRLECVGVYHAGSKVPRGASTIPARGLVGAAEGGELAVGVFEDDAARPHVMVVSRDTVGAANAKVTLQRVCRGVERFDVTTGRWQELAVEREQFTSTVEVPLRPGGGALLRLTLRE
ncbi:hypothetical protein HQ576_11715 [bacterium]|nr:hypothetical protein [bacterium]